MGGGCQISPIYAVIVFSGHQASSESLGSQHFEWIAWSAQRGYTHGWKGTGSLMVNVSKRNGFLSNVLLLPYLLTKTLTLPTSTLYPRCPLLPQSPGTGKTTVPVGHHSRLCTIPGFLSHSSPSRVPSLPSSRFQGSIMCMSTQMSALQAALSFWFPFLQQGQPPRQATVEPAASGLGWSVHIWNPNSLKSYGSRNCGWQRFLLLTVPTFPSGCFQSES